MKEVWVFMWVGAQFPSGDFSTKEKAEQWIKSKVLQGTLTKYPVDISVYEWALSAGLFNPKRNNQKTREFIQRFTSASQEHYHYKDGKEATE